ncbi:unnamed protein product [Urochloa humidicola]
MGTAAARGGASGIACGCVYREWCSGSRVAAPHFAHCGEYMLTVQSERWDKKHLHAHKMRDAGVWSVRIGEPGTAVAYCKDASDVRTFAYVETTEPLSIYKVHRGIKGGSSICK